MVSTANEKKKDEKASFPTKSDKQMSNKVGGCENQPVGIMFLLFIHVVNVVLELQSELL